MTELEGKNCDPEIVYLNKKPYTLGRKIAAGGEGRVHILPELPGKVLKLLNTDFASPTRHDHIQAIIRCGVSSFLDNYFVASLPENLAYDADGRFVGYSMTRIRSRLRLHDLWLDQDGFFRHFPMIDRYAVAYNLAEALDHLHRHNLVMGDINPSNIVLNGDGSVTLCDLGGCSVTDPVTGAQYENNVGIGDYLAPEIGRNDLTKVHFTKEMDNFSLAVLIFQIITMGCHPFNTARTDYRSKAYSSYCFSGNKEVFIGSAYYVTVPEHTIPEYAKPFLLGVEPFEPLFRRVFGYDSSNACSRNQILQRPTPREWMDALKAEVDAQRG